MYAPSEPQPSYTIFGEGPILPPRYGRDFSPGTPTQTIEGYQPGVPYHSNSETILWQANQVYGREPSSALASAQGVRTRTPHGFGMWTPSDSQGIEQVLPTLMEGRRADHATTTSCYLYNQDHNLTRYQQTLPSFDEESTSTSPRPLLDQPSTLPLHALDSRQLFAVPSLPPPILYQSSDLIPLYATSRTASTEFLRTRSHLRVLHSNCGGSPRLRRTVRVIEHGGLRLDEEELIKGLMEPDGMITVHQCHWEEDRSPCHLWIRGNESFIRAHIQRWHGGMSGGDKHRRDCRWSGCGTTMRKDSIARHIVTKHLEEMWECQGCGQAITRGDVYRQHVVRSDLDACRLLDALITYSGDAREVDAGAALESVQR